MLHKMIQKLYAREAREKIEFLESSTKGKQYFRIRYLIYFKGNPYSDLVDDSWKNKEVFIFIFRTKKSAC